MKATATVMICGLVWTAAVGASSEARANAVIVETFTGDFTAIIPLPLNDGGGILVAPPGPLVPGSINFTPGAVTFEGQPIDFSGTEANFIASTYEYQYSVPNVPPPATVPADGAFGGNGPIFSGPVTGGANVRSLDLGPGFSEHFLDIVAPQSTLHTTTIPNWQSPVVPELNGRTVIWEASADITSVDPIAGLVNVVVTGNILAVPCQADFDHDGSVGITDFLLMLAVWGPCPGCPEDLDGDNVVSITDFLLLLASWGPCG
jgi:hypothetical protein